MKVLNGSEIAQVSGGSAVISFLASEILGEQRYGLMSAVGIGFFAGLVCSAPHFISLQATLNVMKIVTLTAGSEYTTRMVKSTLLASAVGYLVSTTKQ